MKDILKQEQALGRLSALFQNRVGGRAVRYDDIALSYITQKNTRLSVACEEPAAMADYLQAAFSPANSALFTRFNRAHYAGAVIVDVPGDIFRRDGRYSHSGPLARLRFFDRGGVSELCFEDNDTCYNGPTLEAFVAALRKAGDDWGVLDLQPRTPHLRVVRLNDEPKP